MKEIHLKIQPKEDFLNSVKKAKEKAKRVQRLANPKGN